MARKLRSRALCLAAALGMSATSGVSGDLSALHQALAPWAPTSVTMTGTRLTVRLPERRITDDIYHAILPFGVCMTALTGDATPAFDEVHIENSFGAQAWVFEGGTQDCAEIVTLPVGDVRLFVAARTHLR